MKPRFSTCATLLAFYLPFALVPAWAQDDKAHETKIPVEMKPFKLTLVDEDAKPVAGVTVTASHVTVDELPHSLIEWPMNIAGTNELITDAAGQIELKYPVKFGLDGKCLTINKIDIQFRHPDYVVSRAKFDPSTEIAQHSLVQGCRAFFTCIDENGIPIKEFAVFMAGRGREGAWTLDGGEVRSSNVPDGKWQTMLISPSADGLHRFSGILPARYAKGKDVTIRGIRLRPGMRLSGSLSDNVPRPIANGKVVAWCMPKPPGEVGDASIGWCDETTIAADGSFEFLSLPSGGMVQLIALCNGWLIEGNKAQFTSGLEFNVSDEQIAENRVTGITLQMKQAAQLEVEVLGPNGKPLAGAEVSTWPNQKLTHGASDLLGECPRTINLIEAQIAGKKIEPRDWHTLGRYIQKTDEHGKAVLRDIPLGRHEELYVKFENLIPKQDERPDGDTIFENAIRYILDSPEPKKLTVNMVPIEEPANSAK